MPIEIFSPVRVLSQSEFHAIDEKVMRIVFDVHNEYGRFFDEAVYKQAIAARYVTAGLGAAKREGRIRMSHRTFTKDLFIDLFFDEGALLEAKTAETLAPSHRSQTLSYLFLLGIQHGRLVNLRPEKVEYEFVSTRITGEKRKQFTVVDRSWEKVNSESLWLKEQIRELLSDWGAFLEVSLYREAITYFLGGAERVFRPIEVFMGHGATGSQRAYLLSDDTAFVFTAVTDQLPPMADHIWRFLNHTRLRYLQWVNFNRHEIIFNTFKNRSSEVTK
jgi:GxxExxY protein